MVFTFNERLAIYFSVQSACLSAAAVTILLGYAIYRWVKRMHHGGYAADASDSGLFLNLMFADLIQAIGNIPSLRWMEDAHITEGHLCTAQAAVKQVGINGVALTSLVIALHTFSVLVLRWRSPRHFSKFAIAGIWLFTALVVGIPNAVHRKEHYYGDTGYWCWIITKYKTEQIMSEYLWVWVAGILMVILYGIMFLVLRGYVIIDEGVHWHKKKRCVNLSITTTENEEDQETRAIANLLLFYPAVYIFCVFPNTLSRWMYFSGVTVPYEFTLFASALFAFSGLFNVVLFFSTRPELVVGSSMQPAVVPNPNASSPTSPSHTHTRVESYSHTRSSKYGHLPQRQVEHVTDNAEKGLLLSNEKVSPDLNVHHSPISAGLHLSHSSGTAYSPRSDRSLGNYSSGTTYLAQSNGSRGGGALPSHRSLEEDVDEEDYGRLPG